DGVVEANVNLATEKASVSFMPELVTPVDLKNAVRGAGYEVVEQEAGKDLAASEREAREKELRGLRNSLISATAFTVPLMLLVMLPMLVPGLDAALSRLIPMQTVFYLSFVLATVVQFGPGMRFLRSGFKALFSGSPDMNSLVALGTSAAYGYSVVATFAPALLPAGTVHVYYEASTAIITLILVGKYLEALAKGRTSEALKKLLGLQAKTARVVRQGEEFDLPIDEVVPGDVVQVRPGERVPLDGSVLTGSSYLDESMITGEP